MSSGADAWRVWSELRRIEECLSWGGSAKPGQTRFDSLGRPIKESPRAEGEDVQLPVSRVQRLHYALRHAAPRAEKRVLEMLGGLDLTGPWPILIAICEEIALLRGAIVAPRVHPLGIAAPPFDGDEAREFLIGFVALTPSTDGTAGVIQGAWRAYERAFRQAWGPTRSDRHRPLDVNGSHGNVVEAALDFSKGHVIMVGVLLTLLAGHIARGAGDRPAMLAEIGNSQRLGPLVRDWVELNEQQLLELMRPQPKAQPMSNRSTRPMSQTQPEPELQAQPHPQPTPRPELEPQPEPEPDLDFRVEPDAELESHQQQEREQEPLRASR